jgi:hypothetical protein
MKPGHTRLPKRSDRAIDAPSFPSSQDNTLKIDEQIFETERDFSPGRDVSMIGDEINRALTRVSEFSDDRLFASNAELSASRTSSHHISSGAIDQPDNSAPVRTANDESKTSWGLLAKALQRVKNLEKADSEKSLALTECCSRLTDVCELWNQQAVELQIARDESNNLGAVIADLNKKIESERSRLSGEKQLRMLSEYNYRELQARTEAVQIECTELSERLFGCDIALDNKTNELASLRETTQQYAETNRALRHQYEAELEKRARLIAQQDKIIKDLRFGQQAAAMVMDKINTDHRALEEENKYAEAKIAALIEHIDLIGRAVLSERESAQQTAHEISVELDTEKNRRLVAEMTLEHSRRDLANLVSRSSEFGNQDDNTQHNVVRFRRSAA